MPVLRDVLPPDFTEDRFGSTEAWELRDTRVAMMKLTTGAPCSSHSELFAAWPGDHQHVDKWYILSDGKAVGINDDPQNGLSFPVTVYDGAAD